mmetsp:Transcript_14474/g.21767  ORF Transcript_14474/g.21767 Transcript_14474/m.21767 type:complete len:277 (-) Transcript_14474:79-909(-)
MIRSLRCLPSIVRARNCSTAVSVQSAEQTSVLSDGRPPMPPKFKDLPPQNIYTAFRIVKEKARARFVETVEVAVRLNVDPRKAPQNIKGMATLPQGIGKKIRVGVFASGGDLLTAKNAGADVFGGEDLIERVKGGEIPFDRVVATPEMMAKLGKIGRILGPRGLMPNPKLGTVTNDVEKAVKTAKAGSVQFRVDKAGIIHAGIGKVDFEVDALVDNTRSLMLALLAAKPEAVKGKYIKGMSVCSTMGRGVPVDLATVDPTSAKFMLSPEEVAKLGF